MELTDFSAKTLPLNAILDKFRKDGQNTEDSKEIQDFFVEEFSWGRAFQSLVKIRSVIEVLVGLGWADAGDDDGVLKVLLGFLGSLEQEHPGAYINLEG